MIYGHFDDSSREFVITDPATPWPWINYLGTEDFFSLISATAGGYCFCRDARYRRILRYRYNGVPMDSGGRYFYINDGGSVWSPGWKPCRAPLDFYECRHGMGYTRITGEKDGLRVSTLFFVPVGHRCEVHKVTLTNTGSGFKSFSLYSFVEWCLWNASTDMENFQRNLSIGEVEIEDGVIYHKTEYRERRNHYAFYGANVPVDGFDTDRDSFLGPYNGFDAPRAVVEDNPGMSVAHGWSPVASHCIDITLEPGETKDVIFVLGYVENPENEKFAEPSGRELNSCSAIINKTRAREMMYAFRTAGDVDKAFDALQEYWDGLLGRFSVSSPVPELDRMVNVWNQYQCMVTFNMSRSASFFESGIGRGMGFRDSNQDLAGFVHQIPQKARERILDIAATQFSDGSCYHQYQPLTKKGNNDIGCGFNDDPLWLVFGTIAYLKETGDFGILAEPVKYADSQDPEVTLIEHLFMSLEHVEKNLGPHKLPLIGRADWNDCLNLNCFSEDPDESFQTTSNMEGRSAESLMIAGLYVFVGKQFVELLRFFEKHPGLVPVSFPVVLKRVYGSASLSLPASALIERNIHNMDKAVRKSGWDGEWYLRAYDFYGNKVGSSSSPESKIFIESQGWCAMARIGEKEGMCSKALDSVKEMLDCEYGIVLNNPAFTRYYKEYGEISSYPQGYKENAGIFCHNNPWIIIADVLDGRIDDAWKHYCKISPAFIKDQELHKVEPYVYCQMVAGKDAARPGEGKNSWLTGTAAWNWVTVSEYLLGIHPEFDGLLIKPCLPASIGEYRVHRVFRDAEYDIVIHNSASGRSTFIPYAPGKHELVLDL